MARYFKKIEGEEITILDTDTVLNELTDFQLEGLNFEVREEMRKRGYVFKSRRSSR